MSMGKKKEPEFKKWLILIIAKVWTTSILYIVSGSYLFKELMHTFR